MYSNIKMLFRNKEGKLEEIKINDYKNDIIYYKKIKSIKHNLKSQGMNTIVLNTLNV